MKAFNSASFPVIAGLILTSLLLITSCTSRYRLDMYMTIEDNRRHVAVESTQLVSDALIGNPYADNKITVGSGFVAVVTFGTRLAGEKRSAWRGFSTDEYFLSSLYVEIPYGAAPDTASLIDKSLVHVLGRYEEPIENRVFLPARGFYVVDSLTDDGAFLTVKGTFVNNKNDSLSFDGRVRCVVD